jgi:hypothetical protein
MRKLYKWLKTRLGTFILLPEYGKATAKQWMNILFGETAVGTIFLIWWALTNPKNPPLILIFVVAVIIAGYFVWRADHVRLIPNIKVVRALLQDTPVVHKGIAVDYRTFIQRKLECTSESPVYECAGYLQRVHYLSPDGWQPTALNESLRLRWILPF